MEFTHKTDARVAVKARLDDAGNISVQLTGNADYDKGRTASATVDVDEECKEKVKQVLQEILDKFTDVLGPALIREINRARDVSSRYMQKGE